MMTLCWPFVGRTCWAQTPGGRPGGAHQWARHFRTHTWSGCHVHTSQQRVTLQRAGPAHQTERCVCATDRVLQQHVIQVCTLYITFLWILITALNSPWIPGPGRVAPLLQLPPALTLTGQSPGDKPSPGLSERVTTLEESMRQLERGIQSGTLCFHFEVFKMQLGAKELLKVHL